jgi:hypothetical protein
MLRNEIENKNKLKNEPEKELNSTLLTSEIRDCDYKFRSYSVEGKPKKNNNFMV